MKKNYLIFVCCLIFGLFIGVQEGKAEESNNLTSSSITTRAKPSKYAPIVIQSGSYKDINVGSIKTKEFSSKYVIKFKTESKEKESLILQELSNYGQGWKLLSTQFYFTNKTESIYKTSGDEEVTGNGHGQRMFRLYNYSATPLNVYFGVNSSIHLNSVPCVDYSTIDFNF